MVSSFIAWYLFLAGMGAGAFFVSALVDLALRIKASPRLEAISAITDGGMLLGPAAVVLGSVFLICDLGAPERAFQVFFTPSTSILTIGSWCIAVFLATSILALLTSGIPDVPFVRITEAVVQCIACIAAASIMIYSGIYLSIFSTIPFLNNVFVPLVFVASALSSGIGLLLIYGFALSGEESIVKGLRSCVRLDSVLLLTETALLTAFLLFGWFANDITHVSTWALITGNLAPLFWLGVVIIGLLLPLICDFYFIRHPYSFAYTISAGCSIIGGLCLRYTLLLATVRFSAIGMSPVTFWG